MIESPAYELIRREGFEEGIREGMERGMVEDAREMVLEVLEERFGVVPPRIAEAVRRINERVTLKGLVRGAVRCFSLEEFERLLNEALR